MTTHEMPHTSPDNTTTDPATTDTATTETATTQDPLLTIGAFARAAGLTPSALRHYDEVGLLPAAHVDPVNGYRYYDPTQQHRARLVATLRQLETPIQQMAELVALSDLDLAGRLEGLAEDLLVTARDRADRLRRLAESLAPSAAGPGVHCCVPARSAADALRRVSSVTGAPPFDAVLLMIEHDQLTWWATNRCVMATVRLTGVRGHGSGRVTIPSSAVPAVVAALDANEPDIVVAIEGTRVHVGGTTVDGADATDFADLPSLGASFSTDATQHLVVVADQLLAGEGHPVLDHGDVRITFTRELLTPALQSLEGSALLVQHGDALHPVTFNSLTAPDHRVVVMPRHV